MPTVQGGKPRRLRLLACAVSAISAAFAGGNDEPAASEVASEIRELKQMLFEQQRQIDELRRALQNQRAGAMAAAVQAQPAVAGSAARVTSASVEPAPGSAAVTQQADAGAGGQLPLSLRVGDASLTPVGFVDFTSVFRDTTAGSNIGTNFGSFPYRTPASTPANLSEFRFSPQNSRIGMRLDTIVKGTKVLTYWESDFLAGINNPPAGNIAVSTNSYPLRLRLFWVDLKRSKWEILAGQTWSLITPGRTGISPLPGDIFYAQTVDVNYMAGLPWGRIPELRFVYRPNRAVSMAIALENPEQYIGGSGGAGTVTLPSGLAAAYGSQLSNGSLTLNTPNLHPDVIAKIALDGRLSNGNAVHFEVAGIERTFKTYNPGGAAGRGTTFTKAAGAVSANLNFEVAKNLRVLTNNYYSSGGGRYLFGEAPDLVVSADGHLSLVHSMSTVSGLEFERKNTTVYGYYGGIYAKRNVVMDTNGSPIGYGYSGAPNSQNKSIQEITFGLNQTVWKDAKWGALNFMTQYAYFTRNPWFVSVGSPKHAYMNEFWINLRYTLPGSPPNVN